MIARFLGRVLKGIHAGESRMAWHDAATADAPDILQLSSTAFPAGGLIPLKYAGPGVGENLSPALAWYAPPAGTVELVLVMEDPDAPLKKPFVHLIAHGIAPQAGSLPEGSLSVRAPTRFAFGKNTFGSSGYQGPRALPGHGPHCYAFQLFALSQPLRFSKPPTLGTLLQAMQGRVIARGRLDGFFEQK